LELSHGFFDLEGKFASFPSSEAVDGYRSCRTFITLFCKKNKSLVQKYLPFGEQRTGGNPAISKTGK